MAERRHVPGATHHAQERFDERFGAELDEALARVVLAEVLEGRAVLQSRNPDGLKWLATVPGDGQMSVVTDLGRTLIVTVHSTRPRLGRWLGWVKPARRERNWRLEALRDLGDTE